MHPQLLEIPLGPLGSLPINSYGLMVMLGFLAAILVATRRSKQENISPEVVLDIGIISMISGIIGARILYLIIYGSRFDWQIFNIFDGNLNLIGLIVGWFIPFGVFYFRRFKRQKSLSKKVADRSVTRGLYPAFSFLGLLVISFASALVLGRLVYLVGHQQDYEWTVLKIWEGGLVFYGGIILGIIGGIIYLFKKRLNILQVGDLIAPVIALGLAFGRLGCFLNGCCFGKIAQHIPWVVCFPKITSGATHHLTGSPPYLNHLEAHLISAEATCSLPVHPVQLYESLFAVVLFFALSFIWRAKHKPKPPTLPSPTGGKGKREGIVLGLLILIYGIWRFLIEFLRGDSNAWLWGLTVYQIISLGVILLALVFVILRLRQSRQEPSVKTL